MKKNKHTQTMTTVKIDDTVEIVPKSCYSIGYNDNTYLNGLRFNDFPGFDFCSVNARGFYNPPIPLALLARLTYANAHHGAALRFKRNQMVKFFQASPALSRQDFIRLSFDYLVLGNCYLQKIYNKLKQIIELRYVPALNIRRIINEKKRPQYAELLKNSAADFISCETCKIYKPGELLHLLDYDINQEIYGVPEWLGGLQSVLLNEEATLFRRKYYQNGCHIGFILYTNDPALPPEVEKDLKEKIASGKGVGNFKSMFINIPNGAKDAIQIIPVGDEEKKDDFTRIKNISADDVIVAHRLPPALAGLKPENAGGFGDISKISAAYMENETRPLSMNFLEINDILAEPLKIGFNFPALE